MTKRFFSVRDGSELADTSSRPATEACAERSRNIAGYYSQVGLRRPFKPPQGGFASP